MSHIVMKYTCARIIPFMAIRDIIAILSQVRHGVCR